MTASIANIVGPPPAGTVGVAPTAIQVQGTVTETVSGRAAIEVQLIDPTTGAVLIDVITATVPSGQQSLVALVSLAGAFRPAYQWPFTSLSPWNAPVGTSATYSTGTDTRVTDLSADHGTVAGTGADGWPIYLAASSDPGNTVTVTSPSTTITLPIPAGAVPSSGATPVMVVISADESTAYEFTGIVSSGTNTWTAASYAQISLQGDGVTAVSHPILAYGGSAMGGIMRSWEVDEGVIGHALAVGLATTELSTASGVFPASAAAASGTGHSPLGTMFAIPQTVNLATLGLSASGLIVAKALQNYGGYVVRSDTKFTLYAESGISSSFLSALNGSGGGTNQLSANASGIETSAAGWAAGDHAASVSRITSDSHTGTACLQVTCVGTPGLNMTATGTELVPYTSGQAITLTAWAKSTVSASNRVASPWIQFLDASQNQVDAQGFATTPINQTTWTQSTQTGLSSTAAGVAQYRVMLEMGTNDGSNMNAGETAKFDDISPSIGTGTAGDLATIVPQLRVVTNAATSAANLTAAGAQGGGTPLVALAPPVVQGPASSPTAPAVPTTVTPPTITGSPVVGQTLTVNHGAYTGSPTAFSEQWGYLAGSTFTPITGATAATYTVVSGDVGHQITVQELAHNSTGVNSPAAQAIATAAVTSTTGGTNTVQRLHDAMTIQHETRPHGVPTNYSWAYGPEADTNPPPANRAAGTAWAQIYEDAAGSTATNVRVQIRRVEFYVRTTSGLWVVLQQAVSPQGQYYLEDFSNNASFAPDIRDESANGGGISVKMVSGYLFHFWPPGRANLPSGTQLGFSTYQARVILDNTGGVDDRAQARYIGNSGGDWWQDLNAGWPNNTQWAEGQFGRIPTDGTWRAFSGGGWPAGYNGNLNTLGGNTAWPNFSGYTSSGLISLPQLDANPPPLNAMGN